MDAKNFIIEYDYFGISGSAEVKEKTGNAEQYYKCFLHSSADVISIKKVKEETLAYWIDIASGTVTPLSHILGQAIESKI
jgi:hypothetical protein